MVDKNKVKEKIIIEINTTLISGILSYLKIHKKSNKLKDYLLSIKNRILHKEVFKLSLITEIDYIITSIKGKELVINELNTQTTSTINTYEISRRYINNNNTIYIKRVFKLNDYYILITTYDKKKENNCFILNLKSFTSKKLMIYNKYGNIEDDKLINDTNNINNIDNINTAELPDILELVFFSNCSDNTDPNIHSLISNRLFYTIDINLHIQFWYITSEDEDYYYIRNILIRDDSKDMKKELIDKKQIMSTKYKEMFLKNHIESHISKDRLIIVLINKYSLFFKISIINDNNLKLNEDFNYQIIFETDIYTLDCYSVLSSKKEIIDKIGNTKTSENIDIINMLLSDNHIKEEFDKYKKECTKYNYEVSLSGYFKGNNNVYALVSNNTTKKIYLKLIIPMISTESLFTNSLYSKVNAHLNITKSNILHISPYSRQLSYEVSSRSHKSKISYDIKAIRSSYIFLILSSYLENISQRIESEYYLKLTLLQQDLSIVGVIEYDKIEILNENNLINCLNSSWVVVSTHDKKYSFINIEKYFKEFNKTKNKSIKVYNDKKKQDMSINNMGYYVYESFNEIDCVLLTNFDL